MSTTVRISASAHRTLKEESESTGQPMQSVLEEAIEMYRRRRFLAEVNAAYARVREDEAAWGDELEERQLWDQTIGDGLDDV